MPSSRLPLAGAGALPRPVLPRILEGRSLRGLPDTTVVARCVGASAVLRQCLPTDYLLAPHRHNAPGLGNPSVYCTDVWPCVRVAGCVVTFYSYKGGTGRTMALANTAWILAANGQRVLAVDWDLEAPGLHRFFHPFLDLSALAATTGVIDIINEYAWASTTGTQRSGPWHLDYARVEPHAISLTPERLGLRFQEGGSLDFLSAGRQDRSYSATVSSFEWDNFYERLGGGQFLDALRDDTRPLLRRNCLDGTVVLLGYPSAGSRESEPVGARRRWGSEVRPPGREDARSAGQGRKCRYVKG